MKQSHKREKFFWVWGLFLKLFAFFPPLMVFTMLGRGQYNWREFGVQFLLLLGVSMLSLVGTAVMRKLKKRKEVRSPVAEQYEREVLRYLPKKHADTLLVFNYLWYAVGLAVSVGAVWFTNGFDSVFFSVPTVLLLAICWGRVFRLSQRDGVNLLSLGEYLITGGIYLGCFLLVLYLEHFFGYPYEVEPLSACFAFLSVSFGFLLNQANLDRTMEDMKYKKDSLPKKIRVYNALLIGGFMVLLVLGYLFRVQIVDFLAWAGRSLVFVVASFVLWLINLIPYTLSAPGVGSTVVPEGSPFLQGEKGGWDWILLLFLLALVVFLFTPPGRRLLARVFSLPVKLLKYLFARFSPEEHRRGADETRYYVDRVEDLERTSRTGKTDPSGLTTRKLLKRWRKTDDPAKKVRLGYDLLRHYAQQNETELTLANTARETAQMTEMKPFGFAFPAVVPVYEEVRYGEKMPNANELRSVTENVERVYRGKYAK